MILVTASCAKWKANEIAFSLRKDFRGVRVKRIGDTVQVDMDGEKHHNEYGVYLLDTNRV
jgi:hypothetical protein